MKAKKSALTSSKLVCAEKNWPTNKKQSLKIINSFFAEVSKLMLEGKEIRFPKRGNGTIFLANAVRKNNSYKMMVHIKSEKSILSTVVKPTLINFDVTTAGRVRKDKKFSIRFAYPRRAMDRLQKDMKSNPVKRKLPEIQ